MLRVVTDPAVLGMACHSEIQRTCFRVSGTVVEHVFGR